MSTIRTEIERDLMVEGEMQTVPIQLEVTYTYHKGSRETYSAYGWQPAEPAECEIEKCIDLATGDDVELTEREQEHIRDECLENVRSEYEAAMEARYDARKDDRL
jgi:hypothetical protein